MTGNTKLPYVVIVLGGIGFALDLVFHWVSAGFETSASWQPVSVLDFAKQLLIDVNPSLVPMWVTVLGITAHVFFFTGFPFMVWLGYRELRKRK